MKKLFSLALVCSFLFIGSANAQNETYYGGKKGSFAITVGADPVINFVGNMFNGTLDNHLSGIGASLAGKWYVGNQFALTFGLGIDNYKTTTFTLNPEDTDYKEVIGKNINGSREFSLNLGGQYNFRSGKRLQPFIAADLFYGRTNANYKVTKEFEAKYEEENYWGEMEETKQYDSYLKESSPRNTFGCLAKLGVEYFLGKSVSVSAALDLGVYTSTAKSVYKYKTDDRDVTNEEIDALNYKKKTSKNTVFATGLMNGNIAFNFYF